MSRELFKMNMIASVQKLDNEDIEIIQNYIKTIEQENKQLKERIKKVEDYASKVGDRRNELYDKIDKAIEYIKENCIDDEFYVNLTKKEKCIIEVLEILGEKE